MKIISQNNCRVTSYDPHSKVLFERFTGSVNAEDTIEILAKSIEFSYLNKVCGSVLDLTSIIGSYTTLNNYIAEDYLPVLISRGLKCSAVVISDHDFAKVTQPDLPQHLGTFQLRIFNNIDKGKDWVIKNCMGTIL